MKAQFMKRNEQKLLFEFYLHTNFMVLKTTKIGVEGVIIKGGGYG